LGEGVLGPKLICNDLKNALKICEHLVIPKVQDPIAALLEMRRSDLIGHSPSGMLAAIDFDD
jgi:hypothetical protein